MGMTTVWGGLTCLGMRVDDGDHVRLRGSLDQTMYLTIGGVAEIMLGEGHVRTLYADAAAALRDVALLDAAETAAGEAFDAGAQARTAVTWAMEAAEAARQVGAVEVAEKTEELARKAIEAADRAQEAVRLALEALEGVEDATETVGHATAKAWEIAPADGDRAARSPRPV